MLIGLTYDLREDYLALGYGEEDTAELDAPETIAGIAAALEAHGHRVDRIGHIRDLARRLVAGERWDLVFNIAEGLHGFGREAQVPALLEAYGIPCTFSDTLSSALTLHKAMAKHVVRGAGLPTADFAVVESPLDLEGLALPFPLFAKPVAEGTGKGVGRRSRAENTEELGAVCVELLARFQQPVLVETYLPGREYTVGIVGSGRGADAIGVMEVCLLPTAEAGAYTYHNKEHYQGLVEYRLVTGSIAERAAQVALGAWRALGCRDGGRVDLREDSAGTPSFLEVNPLSGLHPLRSDLVILAGLQGLEYPALIGRILDSALQRMPPDVVPARALRATG